MTSRRIPLVLLTASLLLGVACGGGASSTRSPDPPPSIPGNYCLRPGGNTAVHTERLVCALGAVTRPDTECAFFINAVTSSGPAFQQLNVSPAFENVDESDSENVPITMVSGAQPGTVTVQVTHQNCREQPNCQPRRIATVNVSNLCP